MILKILERYFHTIKYLKPIQLYGRIKFRLPQRSLYARQTPLIRHHSEALQTPIPKHSHLLSENKVVLLNQIQDISSNAIWNDKRLEKLWLYNLHYFDFLHSQYNQTYTDWHTNLMQRWIKENPPLVGEGWESYPISLRIINWIKWLLLNEAQNKKDILHSLSMQARHLSRRIEIHLLGNHIIANACALIYSGLFFAGKESDGWLSKGLKILNRELKRQILDDGAHFELSPMYHSIILENILDCINIFKTYGKKIPPHWITICERMLYWLACLCHPDFDIAFFNDAALGVAPSFSELHDYHDRLGLDVGRISIKPLEYLRSSGYCRLTHDKMLLIADVAPVGASYQPGHAHADTLSFELSLQGQRLFVNSGTSTYSESYERARQRSTGAHNTVSINNHNSSEVWKSFRVGRRANVLDVSVYSRQNELGILAKHDGYKKQGVIHERSFMVTRKKLTIQDNIKGNKKCEIQVRFHLHPQIKVKQERDQIHFFNQVNHYLGKFYSNHPVEVMSSTYHPEFNISVANKVLVINLSSQLPAQITSLVEWD